MNVIKPIVAAIAARINVPPIVDNRAADLMGGSLTIAHLRRDRNSNLGSLTVVNRGSARNRRAQVIAGRNALRRATEIERATCAWKTATSSVFRWR